MLEYEREEIRNHLMAKKIQGMYRSKKSRDWVKKLLLTIVKKHWDPTVGAFYYVNERTGIISWEKPKQLGTQKNESKLFFYLFFYLFFFFFLKFF